MKQTENRRPARNQVGLSVTRWRGTKILGIPIRLFPKPGRTPAPGLAPSTRRLGVLAGLATVLTIGPSAALGQPGGVIRNGSSSQPYYIAPADLTAAGVPGVFVSPTVPGFLFEPETPYASLKEVPTWNELEQLLDNPYLVAPDPGTPGNFEGFPSYRSTVVRRPNITAGTTLLAPGPALPGLLMHPLNYNPTTGEEMRLLNPTYRGGPWIVPDQLYRPSPVLDPNTWLWSYRSITVSPGGGRVLETAIDYNGPIPNGGSGIPANTPISIMGTPSPLGDPFICITNVEVVPPEGTMLCGFDPGEPGYLGFGVLGGSANARTGQYSTPALQGGPASAGAAIAAGARLWDATRNPNVIQPRNPAGTAGGLRKPSLRTIPGGNNNSPNYIANADPNNVAPSNENDYYRPVSAAAATDSGLPLAMTGRNAAVALGKALFWDMQVGSDSVQSCATCHSTGAGVDARTKNQLNPNHLGGDLALQLGDTPSLTSPGSKAANYQLKPTDYPFHKLANPDVAGDPLAVTPVVAHINAGVLSNTPAASTGATGTKETGVTMVVADAGNIASDVNDVTSSMGVIYGTFGDIAPIGTFVPGVLGVSPIPPEVRGRTTDPIPAFQGFRRVEPRNTPTMQGAAFHFDNFWDGRARHDFNGGSVFGAADPQAHVWVDTNGVLTATRQIIHFSSIASLATGPALSEFEMSFQGRNWSKVGKKLLQAGAVPLANQLVDPDDSVLGPLSNQRTTPGKPGLNVTYEQLIKAAFFPALWQNASQHLNGFYTDGDPLHPNQAPAGSVAIPVLAGSAVVNSPADPFDNFVLAPGGGPAVAADSNQFRQIEANFSLFWGLGVQAWVEFLVPDNTPFDQFLEHNPDAFMSMGDTSETLLVDDLLNCTTPGRRLAPTAGNPMGACFTEWGNFKRDPNAVAYINATAEGGVGATAVPSGGTRRPSDPDPLLGADVFFASNLSLKNPGFRSGRCGACHNMPTLTDNTMPFTFKAQLIDFVSEFAPTSRGVELLREPLGRLRVISGFLLESEMNENGQDAIERRFINQSIVPRALDGIAYPGGLQNPNGPDGIPGTDDDYIGADQAFLDNGVYNLGVRPTDNDIGRGGPDAFGWPLSLASLMLKNAGGVGQEPGTPLPNFNPSLGRTGGLFEESAQDQQINPGVDDDLINPLLPAYLAAFANRINVGDVQPELDEVFGGLNTLTDVAMLEGFGDVLGPINPSAAKNENNNNGEEDIMGTWPDPNRVVRDGAFKAPPLRNVELSPPYFHNGGTLTLRQVVDFYARGGDFPITNAKHRDFLLVNLNIEAQSNLSEAEKVALVDFLLELTDERNRYEQAPFDHPEVIIPLEGTAPDNTGGRAALLAATVPVTDPLTGVVTPALYQVVPAVGKAGKATPTPVFMNVSRFKRTDPRFGTAVDNFATVSHYDR